MGSFFEALWQMTPIRAAFICSKACDIIAEDAFSVASQHSSDSSALFLRWAGSAWQEVKGRYSWISELRLEDRKRVTFYFWTLQEDPTSHKVTLFSWTFLELLAYLVMLTSSELLSCVQGADTSIPTCSRKSPLAWQSSCADTSPKWEVSTPCPKTKRTREDAILKREQRHSSTLSKATCELLQPGQSGVLRG